MPSTVSPWRLLWTEYISVISFNVGKLITLTSSPQSKLSIDKAEMVPDVVI